MLTMIEYSSIDHTIANCNQTFIYRL